jgi:peptidoglycan/LPS O-acetylase OafA/YrhL
VTAAGTGSERNRYIDSLRALAIARVILYHVVGWAWLSLVFPAMGVMFAIAGSLMARSLTTGGGRKAVTSRVRRLLPALWALAAIAVPLMLWHGWSGTEPDHPLRWPELAFWVVPISDPPGSAWGEPFWQVLWYLRAYLLFVLVSPLLWALYRRLTWLVVAAPLAAIAALQLTGFRLPDPLDGIMWDFVTYGACWIIGFAHRDGRLARLPIAAYLGLVTVLGAAGGYWLFTHEGTEGYDINSVPVARALWSLAFTMLVLRWRPSMTWLRRVPAVSAAVDLINARAVTIYLWHYPLITVAVFVMVHLGLVWGTPAYIVVILVIEVALILVSVAALGWVEDVAAQRRPVLWPTRPGRRPEPAPPAPALALAGADPESGRHRA